MRRLGPALLSLVLLAAACSSGDDASPGSTTRQAANTPTSTAPPTDDGSAGEGHACDQGRAFESVDVEPVADSDSDHTLTSPDGTEIRLHWFPVAGASADAPAPTILMGPGWSLPGDTKTRGAPLFGALSISAMHERGYNVLTWDPRGFGASGGKATVNDPEHEGADVQAMLDFVAEQPEALVDAVGDPRSAMVGFSYGGGIQLITAAIDCRVDAIVPGIAWHSLQTSLYKADTVKAGWANVLTSTVPKDRLDPHIVSATESGLSDGTLSQDDQDWFVARGPGDLVGQIDIPTLLIGGTVDTLFTLDENLTNYKILDDNDVETSMLWFCGGHGTCLTEAGDPDRVETATFAWLDRHLKGDESVETGPALDLVDQNGKRWTTERWPVGEGSMATFTAEGSGTLELRPEGGAGGIQLAADSTDPMGGVVAGITPAPADNAVEVPIEWIGTDMLALGSPLLSLTYAGTTPDGPEPTRVFAQLVDDELGVVVGNQITPIEVVLDGETHKISLPLEVIAQHVAEGQTVTLQLVANTTAYATPRMGGEITFDQILISVPFVTEGAGGATAG